MGSRDTTTIMKKITMMMVIKKILMKIIIPWIFILQNPGI